MPPKPGAEPTAPARRLKDSLSRLKESNFGESEHVVETIVVRRAFGTVVARTLRMREVQGSIP